MHHKVFLDLEHETIHYEHTNPDDLPICIDDEDYLILNEWSYEEAMETIKEIVKDTIWHIIEMADIS